MNLLTGTWKARAVSAAVRLGIFDSLSESAASSAALAARLQLHEGTVARLLRLLSALGLLEPGADGTYVLTQEGAVLTSSHPASLRPLAELYDEEYFDLAWKGLDTGLREGVAPFRAVYGRSVFDYLADHPPEASRYTAAIGAGAPYGPLLADAVGLYSPRLVVDLGGGNGVVLAEVLKTCPGARGVLVDRPEVTDQAAETLTRAGLGDRVEVVGGDFFADVPSGADVYLLSRVLHNWDDASCVALLRSVGAAAARGGKVLVVERMVRERDQDGPGDVLALLFDLHMLVMTDGRERSEGEYAEVAAAAGLTVLPSVALCLGFSVLPLVVDEGA